MAGSLEGVYDLYKQHVHGSSGENLEVVRETVQDYLDKAEEWAKGVAKKFPPFASPLRRAGNLLVFPAGGRLHRGVGTGGSQAA